MESSIVKRLCRIGGAAGRGVASATLVVMLSTSALAADLSSGDFKLNLDTTLTWGLGYRLEDPDKRIIGLTNGGTAYSVNGDDGNLNFEKGIFSNAVKATMEIDFAYKNFGIFTRGFGFYDYEIEQYDRARTQLSSAAMDRVGSRAELLDAFAWLKFRLGDAPAEIRVGEQVLSWGESTFIQNGINVVNPVDVSVLRVPGAEIREALMPIGLVWGSISVSPAVSFEGFYQYRWEETIIDPPGSYFSTNDFAGRGGTHVFLGFGEPSDIAPWPSYAGPDPGRPFMGVPRANTREAEDGGQYGVAMRLFAEGLAGTEFGFYYMNYHSRLPAVSGISGTLAGAVAAQQAGQAAALRIYAAYGVPPGVNPTVDAIAMRAANAAATDAFASTANYFVEYPEDIKLYGLSWNAQLGTTGIAFQGDLTHRQDAPYLVDDVELLFAALSPISAGLAAVNQVVPGGATFSQEIPGYIRLDSTQFQFTTTKIFGPSLGADQSLLLLEAAVTHVHDFPDKDVLRMEGPGTYTSGNPLMSGPTGAHAGKPAEAAEHFADATSWGYRLVGRLDFLNAVGPWNLSPRFAWQHDVSGVSPAPGGNFIEGLTALTLGVAANLQATWEVDLSYNMYGGAGRYNLLNDRDFVAANVKYSF